MAYHNGPKIVTDGLVMALDAGNVKSFRGEPTTNFVPSPYNYSTYAYASGPVDTTVLDENFQTITAKRYTITSVVNTARGAIYPEGLVTGSFYTLSLKWKYNGTNTTTPSIAVDASKGNPEGTGNNNTFSSLTTQTTVLQNGWYYTTHTFSFATVPTGKCMLTYGIVTGTDTNFLNQTFDVYQAQFEQKAYATPYVSGSRGTTVATGGGLVDLSGNSSHGELIGPIYNSTNGGNLTFDGTNDLISVTTAPSYNTNVGTISAWAYPNISNSGTIFMQYNTDLHRLRIYHENERAVVFSGYSTTTLNLLTNIGTVPLGRWNHICFTYDFTVNLFTLYVNGVVLASATNTTVPDIVGMGEISIGAAKDFDNPSPYYSDFFNGRMTAVNIYNRTLVAHEIVQMFNSTRGRFGI